MWPSLLYHYHWHYMDLHLKCIPTLRYAWLTCNVQDRAAKYFKKISQISNKIWQNYHEEREDELYLASNVPSFTSGVDVDDIATLTLCIYFNEGLMKTNQGWKHYWKVPLWIFVVSDWISHATNLNWADLNWSLFAIYYWHPSFSQLCYI